MTGCFKFRRIKEFFCGPKYCVDENHAKEPLRNSRVLKSRPVRRKSAVRKQYFTNDYDLSDTETDARRDEITTKSGGSMAFGGQGYLVGDQSKVLLKIPPRTVAMEDSKQYRPKKLTEEQYRPTKLTEKQYRPTKLTEEERNIPSLFEHKQTVFRSSYYIKREAARRIAAEKGEPDPFESQKLTSYAHFPEQTLMNSAYIKYEASRRLAHDRAKEEYKKRLSINI